MTTNTATPAGTDWTVKASDVKAGDRFRSLGRGYIARTVESVEHICNCQGRSRSVDPVTREPLHFPVVVIHTANMTHTTFPHTDVVLTDSQGL